MTRIEAGQLTFAANPENTLMPVTPPETPVLPERGRRFESYITASGLERIIYRESGHLERQGIFEASLAVGSAIDAFLVPANFIYRKRGKYCFPPDEEWDLKHVFSRFYPTGWDFEKILALLEKHRPSFWVDASPLDPQNPHLEKRNIKGKLFPLWQEFARDFRLDILEKQSAMRQENGLLLPSGQTASREKILQIGQRIVDRRFYDLISDDQDYTYIAQPDCVVEFEMDGKTFYIHVRPDYIKSQRDRKTTKEKRIVAKRIVGDFKNSASKDLTDPSTPFGQFMLVYNWLLLQIGQKFKQKPQWITLANRQKRRVFLIPPEVKNPLPQDEVQTALEFLKEGPGQIFYPMPILTPEAEEQAKNILENALRKSQTPKF